MILIKLFKLDAITLKQRLMVEFFIIFMIMLTLSLTCVFVVEGKPSYIYKIVEMFKAANGSSYFTVQCYYRAEDTAAKGKPSYICKIVEMFEAMDGSSYFITQWYHRAKDMLANAKF
ncbi:dna (cytosine-5)-methyltransferase cmt3 [Quercus suber]|uniref:Dna (Cytosine-5)-methyltransferase cmt3 n=1 Tax=Quercus suber TaxID=58331 RepID=A0AAW0K4D1_QUESU